MKIVTSILLPFALFLVSSASLQANEKAVQLRFDNEKSLQAYLVSNPEATRISDKLMWVRTNNEKFLDYKSHFSSNIDKAQNEITYSLLRPVEKASSGFDPFYDSTDVNIYLWNIRRVEALRAWENGFTGEGVVVAVLDTGLNYSHNSFLSNMWENTAEKNGLPGVDDDGNGYVDDIHGYDFTELAGDPFDGHGHGSHVAGIVAGNEPEEKFYGVAKNAKVMAIKGLSDSGSGSNENLGLAIIYAVDNGAQIINCSWGGRAEEGDHFIYDAIEYANSKGVLVVAAAGNSGNSNKKKPIYPASFDNENIISVAATNDRNELERYSNYGKKTVDLAAPGDLIWSVDATYGHKDMSGTSQAAPHVSGLAAIEIEKFIKNNARRPSLSELKEILYDSAKMNSSLKGNVGHGFALPSR